MMPEWARAAIAIIIAVLIAIGLLLFLPDAESPEYVVQAEGTRPEMCGNEETQEKVRSITIDALDDALKEQITHLFLTWLKDDARQPERARTGIRQAIRAYLHAQNQAQEWKLPLCKPG